MFSMQEFDDLFGITPFLLSDETTGADWVEQYGNYVDSQSSHMDMRNEVCSASEEWEQAPVYEEFTVASDSSGSTLPAACDSSGNTLPAACDSSGSTVPSACGEKKRKGRIIKLKDEPLDLQCGWQDCNYRSSNLDHFVRHVSFHLPHLGVKLNKDEEGTGSVVFPRLLPASSSTWQCHLCNHMLAHINFCSLVKYFRSI
jgi:hypothetical protein